MFFSEKSKKAIWSLFYLFLVGSTPGALRAEIYRWQDSDGKFYYADKPAGSDAQPGRIKNDYSFYRVDRVFDGDTILLEGRRRIRFIGINTPEVAHGRSPAEEGGDVAKHWLQQKLLSQQVRFEKGQPEQDQYGRTLGHVFLKDGTYLNQLLLERGLAILSLFPPNLRYAQKLIEAQQRAERETRGIWQLPAYQAKPVSLYMDDGGLGWQRLLVKPREIRQTRKHFKLISRELFEIRINRNSAELFGDLSDYLNKDLEVRGWPNKRGEKAYIYLRHPSAMIIRN